jgi:hypothetical protein
MKRIVAALAFATALSAGAAFADTVQNGYGNTFVITTADGAVIRYHFNADNTFTLFAPDGSQVAGAYEVANGQICITPTGGERACTGYVGDKNVGDTWTQAAADGSQITVTLQAGR